MFDKSEHPVPLPETDSPIDFARLFNVCRVTLRALGVFTINEIFSKSKRKIWDMKALYYIFWLFPTFFANFSEFRSVLGFWETDVYYALEVTTAVLSGVIVMAQGFFVYHSRNDLLILIAEIRQLWQKQLARNVADVIVKKVKRAKFFTQVYATLIILLAITYSVRPFLLLLTHVISGKNETYDMSQTVFQAIYPWKLDNFYKYIVHITAETVVFVNVSASWIGADMIFLQLATHLAAQYQILHDDLIAVGSGDDPATIQYTPVEQLNSMGKRHAHLLLLSDKFQKIFSPILLVLMLVTSVNICICIINLQEELMQQNLAGVNKCAVHTIIAMIQPAIYCVYANDLVEWAELTAIAAYTCQWVDKTRYFRHSVRLITMRAQEALPFRIYGFFSVDLNLLTQIAVGAARFFAIINNLSGMAD
ncbi:odorant receptor 13a-like isoform X2 [Fopius arisanus]|uniref:Odorant receptor n=1 Tax=Fopius arisanus TaxID=64838 RepID=A0A9R1TV27_9HYME|nr:PREDICTED: odorant receptor 13a-like isoform X2 [Fopius arisanus]